MRRTSFIGASVFWQNKLILQYDILILVIIALFTPTVAATGPSYCYFLLSIRQVCFLPSAPVSEKKKKLLKKTDSEFIVTDIFNVCSILHLVMWRSYAQSTLYEVADIIWLTFTTCLQSVSSFKISSRLLFNLDMFSYSHLRFCWSVRIHGLKQMEKDLI